MELIIEISYSR